MIFNSLAFLFGFLPAVLLLYYAVARFAPVLRRPLLLIATIVFYAFGGLRFTALLIASVAVNFAAAKIIMRDREGRLAGAALAAAIVADLGLLALFKYSDPLIDGANLFAATPIGYLRLVLPVGISFFTFQQIGFLIELRRGRVGQAGWRDYAGFVLFFPTLLAGPIVRYDEVAPQLAREPERGKAWSNITAGFAIFAIGLVKKAMIADTLGLYTAPVFDGAATHPLGMFDAWFGAFAYTAQIYFDFAGYSDMAIGVARMLGIVLPANFHSPLRSPSIAEIWRRWHITLGRWVMSYVFQPLTVPMARLAAARELGKWPAFWVGFAAPMTAAMVTIALWHGAGKTFVFFGLCQSAFMIVNEWWRLRRKALRRKGGGAALFETRAWHFASIALTAVCFSITVVAFRADRLTTMGRIYAAMAGFNGWAGTGLAGSDWPAGLAGGLATLGFAWAVILLAPNTQQFMGRVGPVLEWSRWRPIAPPAIAIEWRPRLRWAIVTGGLFFLGFIFMMRGTTKFIYFNF